MVSTRTQGIARLVIGVTFALSAAATFYFVGTIPVAFLYLASFALAWVAVRAWLGSGRWRGQINTVWIGVCAGLGVGLSNVVISTTSAEISTAVTGAVMSFAAGLCLSVWFSPYRWERLEEDVERPR